MIINIEGKSMWIKLVPKTQFKKFGTCAWFCWRTSQNICEMKLTYCILHYNITNEPFMLHDKVFNQILKLALDLGDVAYSEQLTQL